MLGPVPIRMDATCQPSGVELLSILQLHAVLDGSGPSFGDTKSGKATKEMREESITSKKDSHK